jgi:hypothetical protein
MNFPIENDKEKEEEEEEDWDKKGQTGLNIVSDLCDSIILNILISTKSLPNVVGVDKDTALHCIFSPLRWTRSGTVC